jgi:predicted transcriptional regulator
MKYPKMITIKSDQQTMRRANALARETKRSRSEYVRDLINVLADDQNLRQAVKDKLPESEA